MEIIQRSDQAVDVADWFRDEKFAEYPEGARDKTLLHCLDSEPYCFLKNNNKYLFKLSSPKFPEQFWMEIFSYRLGLVMDVPVPPAFVAYDSTANQSGALIEWFLSSSVSTNAKKENYIRGGDPCQEFIPNFDRKKGTQHNFETISNIFNQLGVYNEFNENWKYYWAKIFVFDALIGNTDRHQDNWGIIIVKDDKKLESVRIAPVFDNGTSMGHEILPEKFKNFDDEKFKKYIAKGRHRMKWNINDSARMQHAEALKKIADKYPETHSIMLECLKKVNNKIFKTLLDDLVGFDVFTKLTRDRADFMLELLGRRHQYLLDELGN